MNVVHIIGNLGRDPELKHTQGGTAVCNLAVATTRKWRNRQTDQVQEKTEWHRVTVWGQQAEHCNRFLEKGRQIAVTGRLETTSYRAEGEQKDRYATNIVAEHVQFLGKGTKGKDGSGNGQGNSQGNGQGNGGSNGGDPGDYVPPGPENDDIPF